MMGTSYISLLGLWAVKAFGKWLAKIGYPAHSTLQGPASSTVGMEHQYVKSLRHGSGWESSMTTLLGGDQLCYWDMLHGSFPVKMDVKHYKYICGVRREGEGRKRDVVHSYTYKKWRTPAFRERERKEGKYILK